MLCGLDDGWRTTLANQRLDTPIAVANTHHLEALRADRILDVLEDQAPGVYISRSLLSHITGITDRKMRRAIEWARRDGWPILSRSASPGGYRLAVSFEDAQPLLDAYTRRAKAMLATHSRLTFHMAKRLHPRQATLPLIGGDENG